MNSGKIQFINVDCLKALESWQTASHRHIYHELIVVRKGKLIVRIGEKKLTAQSGDVLFYQQSIPHSEKTDPDDLVESIYIAWLGKSPNLSTITHDKNGRIRLLAKWLIEEKKSSAAAMDILPDIFFQAILAELERLANRPGNSLVDNIRTYIRDHIAELITLDDLASQACMSKFHFLRKYKILTQRTPTEDLRIMRVEMARDLIISTEIPLKAISKMVGFRNVQYLSRMFRKYLDTTPGYFRKHQQN